MARQCIPNSSNLLEIFAAITSHGLWDYWNYHPLEQIVEEFGKNDPEIKEKMEKYKQERSGFLLTTKIKDYIPIAKNKSFGAQDHLPKIRRDSEYFQKLSVKLDQRVAEYSLHYLETLWESLSFDLLLPSPSVLLEAVLEGSILVVWLIPVQLAGACQLLNKSEHSAKIFQKYPILRVTIDDVCIYEGDGIDKDNMERMTVGNT